MTTVRSTTGVRRALALGAVAGVCCMALYLLHATGVLPDGPYRLYDAWLYCAVLLISGVIVGLRAVCVASERAPWAALAAALLLQVAGWVAYWASAGPGPAPDHPLLADALWLCAYVFAYYFVVGLVRRRAIRFDRALLIDAAIAVLCLAALSAAVVIPRILDTSTDNSAVLVGLTYPLADLVIAGTLVSVFAINGWRPGRMWGLIGVALTIQVVADSIHLYETAGGGWQPGTVLGAALLTSCLLGAVAAWTGGDRADTLRLEGWRMLAVPGAFTLIAIALLVYGSIASISLPAVLLATAALAVAAVRSVTAFRGMIALSASHRRALDAALRDSLTGLFNHRAFHESLDAALMRGRMNGTPISLVMLDLVDLKETNETRGHQAGDERLKMLAVKLAGVLRTDDTAFRIGGDEFAVILPGVQAWDGYGVASRLQRALSGDRWASEPVVSVGVAEAEPGTRKDELIGRADAALLEAKRSHRKTVLYSVGLELQRDTLENGLPRVHTKTLATALARAVDAKDSWTRSHCETVSELCVTIATALGLPPDRIEQLRLAGLLHDVGKIGVPDSILQKPAALTDSEFETMKTHSQLGHSIVSGAGLAEEAKWILHHHERPDGGGYPAGLSGDQIPLESRIILVADAFEAITSDRPYRAAQRASAALAELQRHSGTQFDPRCVAALERSLTERRSSRVAVSTAPAAV